MESDLRLDNKSRMSREVHVRFCEGLGVRFPRAAHLVILLRSERAARRVMESMTDLEETLGLPVNRDKSQVAPVKDVEFRGFQILRGTFGSAPRHGDASRIGCAT